MKPFAAHNNIHETTTQNIIDEFPENEVLINIDANSNLQKNWDKLYAS